MQSHQNKNRKMLQDYHQDRICAWIPPHWPNHTHDATVRFIGNKTHDRVPIPTLSKLSTLSPNCCIITVDTLLELFCSGRVRIHHRCKWCESFLYSILPAELGVSLHKLHSVQNSLIFNHCICSHSTKSRKLRDGSQLETFFVVLKERINGGKLEIALLMVGDAPCIQVSLIFISDRLTTQKRYNDSELNLENWLELAKFIDGNIRVYSVNT